MKLRGPVFEDKVIDLIKSKAKVNIKTLSKDELIKLFNKEEESQNNPKEQKKSEKGPSETKTKIKKTVTSKTSSKK